MPNDDGSAMGSFEFLVEGRPDMITRLIVILGLKTLTIAQRYLHVSPEHQPQAADRLVTRKRGTGSGTSEVTVASGSDVTTEEKWWTGGELNSRHRDFQSRRHASA